MAVHAKFDSIEFRNIRGYRIAACFQSNNGFNGAFYIYLEETLASQDDFKPIDMGKPDPAQGKKRGTLKIFDSDSYRDYTFENIDLRECETQVSHSRKVRYLTFQYDKDVTDRGEFCKITNNRNSIDKSKFFSKVAQDYLFSTGGFTEPLLSFSSRFSREAVELLQFGTLRTKDNSFLELAIQLDEERQNGGIQSHTVKYRGQQTEVTRDNLSALLVYESYGDFLPNSYSLPDLGQIARTTDLTLLTLLDFKTFSPLENWQHAQTPPGALPTVSTGESIETATLILNGGSELDKAQQIV